MICIRKCPLTQRASWHGGAQCNLLTTPIEVPPLDGLTQMLDVPPPREKLFIFSLSRLLAVLWFFHCHLASRVFLFWYLISLGCFLIFAIIRLALELRVMIDRLIDCFTPLPTLSRLKGTLLLYWRHNIAFNLLKYSIKIVIRKEILN